jgi:hypothetical protein
MNRLQEISFNTSLIREMRMIAFMNKLIEQGHEGRQGPRRQGARSGEAHMGINWTATLKAEFEMEDRAPENLAETRLRTEFQRVIETGVIGAGNRR